MFEDSWGTINISQFSDFVPGNYSLDTDSSAHNIQFPFILMKRVTLASIICMYISIQTKHFIKTHWQHTVVPLEHTHCAVIQVNLMQRQQLKMHK